MKTELHDLYAKGYRYLAKNELGGVWAFKTKPCRSTLLNRRVGFGVWVQHDYPDMRLLDELKTKWRKDVTGTYDFLTWESEPVLISELIKE
ncbi:hypothetical protein [Heyndrickxia faecalis]|uniref:hypothetical protein n=1 Tax=Heyndrickxia faecalis TaxID=2824910 RepID=UPI0032B16221